MKTVNVGLIIMALFLIVVIPCGAQDASLAAPEVLSDGANAKNKRVDNMHQTRYIEIFLAAKEAKTGSLVAACYNSMFSTEGIPVSKDTAPQTLVEGLDLEQIKKEYGVATIMPDEHFNVYDKTGPGMTNYKP